MKKRTAPVPKGPLPVQQASHSEFSIMDVNTKLKSSARQPITLKLEPGVVMHVKAHAQRENRSVNNMVETFLKRAMEL